MREELINTRYLHNGKLDAEFLNLVFMGRVADATDEEQELARLLRSEGLTGLKEKLELPADYPVIPLVIETPRSANHHWGHGRRTMSN
jgi:hypothetical protein